MPRRVFVTVGTTSFDALIHACTTPEFANALEKLGFDELRLQVGRGAAPTDTDRTTWFRFAPTITEEMRAADVVISHAGAGSILEALELGKRLVVCVNDALMDNHQAELATRSKREATSSWRAASTTWPGRYKAVVATRPAPYERGDAAPFRALVEDEVRALADDIGMLMVIIASPPKAPSPSARDTRRSTT